MRQGIFQLCIPDYQGKCTAFQNGADSLLLRKDQAAFWGCFIDRNYKDYQIQRTDKIADQWIFMRVFRFQGSDFFF